MEWLSSKESKRIKEVTGRVTALNNNLKAIVEHGEKCRNAVISDCNKIREKEAFNALKNMPVDEINYNKAGIRVNALKDAGLTNVYKVLTMPKSRLKQVEGVGEANVDKIMENAGNLLVLAKENAVIKLNKDGGTTDTNVIVNLFYLTKATGILSEAEKLYNQKSHYISSKTKSAAKMSDRFNWLFTDKNIREQVKEDVKALENLLNSDFDERVAELVNDHLNITKVAKEQRFNDFENNASAYYAVIDNLLGISSDENIAGVKKLSKEALAAGNIIETDVDIDKFVEEINSVKLDLSLLNVTLRRYQEFGTKYIINRKRTLLGDEMGLGKTMQAIAAMTHLKTQGKNYFVVICPLSVLENWKREVSTHSKLNVIGVYGKEDVREEAFNRWLNEGGVCITTYETMKKVIITDVLNIDMVIVDEAHYIKNPEAGRTKAIVEILDNTEYVLYMTGTPIENRVSEMKFLIQCLQPEIAEKIKDIDEIREALNFRQVVMPVYLRRTRMDVLTELPELIEKEQWCEMSDNELKWYKKALKEDGNNFMKLRQLSWSMENIADSTKANRLVEICEEAAAEGRRIIVFSFFLDVLTKVQTLMGEKCVGLINGAVPAEERQGLVDKLKEAPDGSVLVAQIISGGVGLNIQCASVVIFCEPQIKPSMEMQALSRAYRMGQTKDVIVHRLLMADSIDERMMETLKQKTEVFNEFANESIVGSKDIEINEKAMKDIVEEEKKRLGVGEEETEPEKNDASL